MKQYLENQENMDKLILGIYRELGKDCARFNAQELANPAKKHEYMENVKCMNKCIEYLIHRQFGAR